MFVKEKKSVQNELESKETRGEKNDRPTILEEITIEELAVDGICGIY